VEASVTGIAENRNKSIAIIFPGKQLCSVSAVEIIVLVLKSSTNEGTKYFCQTHLFFHPMLASLLPNPFALVSTCSCLAKIGLSKLDPCFLIDLDPFFECNLPSLHFGEVGLNSARTSAIIPRFPHSCLK